MIESGTPKTWSDLQRKVRGILAECGIEAITDKPLQTVRGSVNIDVYAEDRQHSPTLIYLCECKHWGRRVHKTFVHGFRTVVADAGAHLGLVVSRAGFQKGCYEVVERTSVKLVDWKEFDGMFEDRWISTFMVPQITARCDPLGRYADAYNTTMRRVFDALPQGKQDELRALLPRYEPIADFAQHWFTPVVKMAGLPKVALPLKENLSSSPKLAKYAEALPHALLEATAWRDFMDTLIAACEEGVAKYEEVIGSRIYGPGEDKAVSG